MKISDHFKEKLVEAALAKGSGCVIVFYEEEGVYVYIVSTNDLGYTLYDGMEKCEDLAKVIDLLKARYIFGQPTLIDVRDEEVWALIRQLE